MSETPQNDKITLAVVNNEIKHMNKSISDLTDELRAHRLATDDRIAAFEYKVDRQLEAKADCKRVEKIEEWMKWAGRIVIGAVMAAVIGSVVVSVKNHDAAPAAYVVSR